MIFKKGDVVRHFKGNLYKILDIVTNASNYIEEEYMIIYMDNTGNKYCRPYSEMIQKVNGIPRFEVIYNL